MQKPQAGVSIKGRTDIQAAVPKGTEVIKKKTYHSIELKNMSQLKDTQATPVQVKNKDLGIEETAAGVVLIEKE